MFFNLRDNWEHAGLRKQEFEHLFRPFHLEKTPGSELEDTGNQCKSCYAIWTTDELGQRKVVQQVAIVYPCTFF